MAHKGQSRTIQVIGGLVLTIMVIVLVYTVVEGEFNTAASILENLRG